MRDKQPAVYRFDVPTQQYSGGYCCGHTAPFDELASLPGCRATGALMEGNALLCGDDPTGAGTDPAVMGTYGHSYLDVNFSDCMCVPRKMHLGGHSHWTGGAM